MAVSTLRTTAVSKMVPGFGIAPARTDASSVTRCGRKVRPTLLAAASTYSTLARTRSPVLCAAAGSGAAPCTPPPTWNASTVAVKYVMKFI